MNRAAMAISPDDRRRLISVLTLLSSNHDGERSAAGAAATRMLQRMNTTWEELIPADAPRQPPPRQHSNAWRVRAGSCLVRRNLTDWERRFLESICRQRRFGLTEKQRETLDRICAKVGVL